MHAPIFYLLNIKIGAQSEQIWHLLRYRTSAPIIGATNNTAISLKTRMISYSFNISKNKSPRKILIFVFERGYA